MMNKYVFGCVDRLMRDMKGNNKLFVVVTLLLCLDFRQVLHVEHRASHSKIISLCLTNTYFLNDFKITKLIVNESIKAALARNNIQSSVEQNKTKQYTFSIHSLDG